MPRSWQYRLYLSLNHRASIGLHPSLSYRVFPCGSCFNATTRIGMSLMEGSSLIVNPIVCENNPIM